MKERLLHILDQSTCLTRRQMKDYLGGTMLPEEVHAAEQHIASCPLCSMALEGFEAHSDEALAAISSLNSGFLKEHFDAITPQIHMNSLAPATVVSRQRRRSGSQALLRISSVAAALLLGFGILWLLDNRRKSSPAAIAQLEQPSAPAAGADDNLHAPPAAERTAAPAAAAPRHTAPPEAQRPAEALPEQSAAPEPAPRAKHDERLADAAPVMAADSEPVRKDAPALQAARFNAVSAKSAEADRPQPSDERKAKAAVREESSEADETARARTMAREEARRDRDEPVDHLQKGDELYGKGSYRSALAHYRSEMGAGSRSRKAQAGIMAARCYRQLGQKEKAISLLEQMMSEGGPQKRAARRMLQELRNN